MVNKLIHTIIIRFNKKTVDIKRGSLTNYGSLENSSVLVFQLSSPNVLQDTIVSTFEAGCQKRTLRFV